MSRLNWSVKLESEASTKACAVGATPGQDENCQFEHNPREGDETVPSRHVPLVAHQPQFAMLLHEAQDEKLEHAGGATRKKKKKKKRFTVDFSCLTRTALPEPRRDRT
jgi:hypothetical protein